MAGFGLNLKLVLYLQIQCLTEISASIIRHFCKLRNVGRNRRKNYVEKIIKT